MRGWWGDLLVGIGISMEIYSVCDQHFFQKERQNLKKLPLEGG